MPDSPECARQLFELAERGGMLFQEEKARLDEIERLVTEEPALVHDRLDELRQDVVRRLNYDDPEQDYARCVSVRDFWRNCLVEEVRDQYEDGVDYEAYLQNQLDPAQSALEGLMGPAADIIVPSERSWLVPYVPIMSMNSYHLKSYLQLGTRARSPFLLLVLPADKLLQFSCKVRTPIGLDAVHKRNCQWRPNGVPDERIDGPIRRGTIERLIWKP